MCLVNGWIATHNNNNDDNNNNINNDNNKCKLIDMTVPCDKNISSNEIEKKSK